MKLEDAHPIIVTSGASAWSILNGVWLDVVQQIEPQPGFWEPYTR